MKMKKICLFLFIGVLTVLFGCQGTQKDAAPSVSEGYVTVDEGVEGILPPFFGREDKHVFFHLKCNSLIISLWGSMGRPIRWTTQPEKR